MVIRAPVWLNIRISTQRVHELRETLNRQAKIAGPDAINLLRITSTPLSALDIGPLSMNHHACVGFSMFVLAILETAPFEVDA
jgi:hypothetical protein